MWPLSANEIYQAITKNQKTEKVFTTTLFQGISTDSRKLKPDQVFVALKGAQYDGHAYLKECFENGTQLALVDKQSKYFAELSEADKNKCICVDDVLISFREFSHFMRSRFPFPVIGIGGSNGKTTTKEMLASILNGPNYKVTKTEKSENGFLGMAITLCQAAHHSANPPSALVLEIGIDDIGAMNQHVALAKPDISLLTALGPEHLEHLLNWETAANEELILFANSSTKRVWQFFDEKIVNAFQEFLTRIQSNKNNTISLKDDYVVVEKGRLQKIGIEKLYLLQNISGLIIWEVNALTSVDTELSFEIQIKQNNFAVEKVSHFKIPLPGIHNASNFALAFASAIMLNRNLNEITLGWSNFVSPPMRSRVSHLKENIILFDDCYNSSPMSLEAALSSIQTEEWHDKEKVIILGDMLDLGNESKYWHEQAIHALKNIKNAYLCLYGSAMYDCFKLLKETEDSLISKNKTRIFWRPTQEDPSEFLTDINANLSGFVILVKGSRGMKLDRVVKSLELKYC